MASIITKPSTPARVPLIGEFINGIDPKRTLRKSKAPRLEREILFDYCPLAERSRLILLVIRSARNLLVQQLLFRARQAGSALTGCLQESCLNPIGEGPYIPNTIIYN